MFGSLLDRFRRARAPAAPPAPDVIPIRPVPTMPQPPQSGASGWVDEQAGLPRGIRNRNPGNLRPGDQWVGLALAQSDASFLQFGEHLYGLRALMIVLLNYHRKHGLDTVGEIIARWAPPSENNTRAYADQVAARLGVAVDQEINPQKRDVLIGLARAIVRHENGRPPEGSPADWYGQDLYDRAADLALAQGRAV
jgi:hypothetical protein